MKWTVVSLASHPHVLVSQASQHFWDTSNSWWLLYPLVNLLDHFPSTCISRTVSLWRWILTCNSVYQSGIFIALFTSCSKLSESVRMMACVVWQSGIHTTHTETTLPVAVYWCTHTHTLWSHPTCSRFLVHTHTHSETTLPVAFLAHAHTHAHKPLYLQPFLGTRTHRLKSPYL